MDVKTFQVTSTWIFLKFGSKYRIPNLPEGKPKANTSHISVQSFSPVRIFVTCSTTDFPVLQQLVDLDQTCSSSQWCHPTIASSVIPFSSCLQSFPVSRAFLMSQLFTSGGQSIGVSASASVLPMNIQDWFPLGWTGLISLQSKGLSRVVSNTTVQKHQFFGVQLSL